MRWHPTYVIVFKTELYFKFNYLFYYYCNIIENKYRYNAIHVLALNYIEHPLLAIGLRRQIPQA
jgi:hypothetical protein